MSHFAENLGKLPQERPHRNGKGYGGGGNRRGGGRRPRNTEVFEPPKKPCDLRVVIDTSKDTLKTQLKESDLLYIPNLFPEHEPGEIFRMITEEISRFDVKKEWHEASHEIADDRAGVNWKNECPTFQMAVDRIEQYFNMDIKATRLNFYRPNGKDWKPLHHDAAAIKRDKARTQNFTVAISFGDTRSAFFEKTGSRTTIELPCPDNSAYCFSAKANKEWKHGILPAKEEETNGRISIIAWGWVAQDCA